MSNLIVLCESCLSWGEPVSDMCPECGIDVDLDRADPDREMLAKIIGEPLRVSGPVRIDRRTLPNFGHLILTSTGLLFVPRLHRRLNGSLEAVTSQRVPGWWPFHGDQSSSRFLTWLRRPFGEVLPEDGLSVPIVEKASEPLVDRLLESPGALFIVRQSVRSITARRRIIQINRLPLRSVSLIDETEDGSLLAALNSLHEQDSGM